MIHFVRTCLLFLLLLCAQLSSGQDLPRWEFGLHSSVMVSYRKLEAVQKTSSATIVIENRNDYESRDHTYNYGIAVRRNVNARFSFVSGIDLQDYAYFASFDHLKFGDMTDPRKGLYYSSADIAFKQIDMHWHFKYLSIPLKVSMNLGKKRFKCSLNVGIYNQYLIADYSRIVKTKDDGSKQVDRQTYDMPPRRFDFSPTLGFDMQYAISDRSNLFCNTYVVRQLLGLGYSAVNEKLVGLGFGLGYCYAF